MMMAASSLSTAGSSSMAGLPPYSVEKEKDKKVW